MSPQQQQIVAQRTRDAIALEVGRLMLDRIEAQTMAQLQAAEGARLQVENDDLKARVAELSPKE